MYHLHLLAKRISQKIRFVTMIAHVLQKTVVRVSTQKRDFAPIFALRDNAMLLVLWKLEPRAQRCKFASKI
jgi:hypothetical protein